MARRSYSKFRSRMWKLVEIDHQLRMQARQGRPCTKQTLLEVLEVDERTLRRLIELMRDDLGAPIEFDRNLQSYKYSHPNWICPSVHLQQEDMDVLAMAVQAIRPVLPEPFSQRLDNLLAVLLDALPEARRDELRQTQGQVEFVPVAVRSKGDQWFEPLRRAIAGRTSVAMTYYVLSRQEATQRIFDPYYLRYYLGAWYSVGYDHRTKNWPVFNLARIRALAETGEPYKVRAFSAARYFNGSLGVMVGGKPQRVRVRLTGYAAATSDERIWPPGFSYRATGPKEGILSGQVTNMVELMQWVASCQGDAEILPE